MHCSTNHAWWHDPQTRFVFTIEPRYNEVPGCVVNETPLSADLLEDEQNLSLLYRGLANM